MATSALLGIVAGVVGGLVVDRAAATQDPLGLGVAEVDQPCTGKTLLVVGARRPRPPSSAPRSRDRGATARYLDTRPVLRHRVDRPRPHAAGYVAYLGPYDSPAKACPVRMTVAHRGSIVTRLESGTTDPVQCLCYVGSRTMPLLRAGHGRLGLDGI